jgi:hypothetical protein
MAKRNTHLIERIETCDPAVNHGYQIL